MSWNNKVIWFEGMFLQPQHFQQQTRYFENYIERRSALLRSFAWGFNRLEIDRELLDRGKFAIASAQGVLADGTPFNIPGDEDIPSPLDILENTVNTIVYLGVPMRRQHEMEADCSDARSSLARFYCEDQKIPDNNSGFDSEPALKLGKLNTQLLLENEKRDDYFCIGVARIAEARSGTNGIRVVLDETYMPPVLNCQAEPKLVNFLHELQGKLNSRGNQLAGQVTPSGRGGAGEIADLLLLQLVNRYEPLVAHLANLEGLHPESLYRLLLEITGELATYASRSERPPALPVYRHDDLESCFGPLIDVIREYTSHERPAVARRLDLKKRQWGFYKAIVKDSSLFSAARFVLEVNAEMSDAELHRSFPSQVQIGPVEKISEYSERGVPGIGLRPLTAVPRQIPIQTGVAYFELDTANELWQTLLTSGAIAMHVSADIPGLEMHLWAVLRQ